MSSIGAGYDDAISRLHALSKQSEDLKTAFNRYKALKSDDPTELNRRYEFLKSLINKTSQEEETLRARCHEMAVQLEAAYKQFSSEISASALPRPGSTKLPEEEMKAGVVVSAPRDLSSIRKKSEIKKIQESFQKIREQMTLLSEKIKKNQSNGIINLNDEFDYFRMEELLKKMNSDLVSIDPDLSRSLRGEIAILQAGINDRIDFVMEQMTKQVDELYHHRNNATLASKLAPKYHQLLKCVEKIKEESDKRGSPLFHRKNQFSLAFSKLLSQDDADIVAAVTRWKKKAPPGLLSPVLMVKPSEPSHDRSIGHLLSFKSIVLALEKKSETARNLDFLQECFALEEEITTFEQHKDHLIARSKLSHHPDQVMDLLEEGPALRKQLQKAKQGAVEQFCKEVRELATQEVHVAAPKYKKMVEFVQRLEKEFSENEHSTNAAECMQMRGELELFAKMHADKIGRWDAYNKLTSNLL